MLEGLPKRNETITSEIDDYAESSFYPLLLRLPKNLVAKHLNYIEQENRSDEEIAIYLNDIINKRRESLTESSISDKNFESLLEVTPEKIFKDLESTVFTSTSKPLGTGMTARVKPYSVPTINGDVDMAIKYVVTPTTKTLTAEQEHNVIKEVERMKKVEEMESKHERRSRHIKVPHTYLHHKSEHLQCYGMEQIKGRTLEEATADPAPIEFLQTLKNSPLVQVPEDELMGYIKRFFQTIHEYYLHGDMKPGNLMVSETGMIYVIDFGQSIANNNVPKGAEEQLSNLQDEEIKIAQQSVRFLLQKLQML